MIPIYLVGGLTLHADYLQPLQVSLQESGLESHILPFPRKDPVKTYIDTLAKAAHSPGIWVGHSFGSQVVEEIARKHPEKVKGIVLAGPAQISKGSAGLVFRLLHDGLFEPVPLIYRAVRDLGVTTGPPKSLAEARLSKKLWKNRGGKLNIPALIIHGQKDRFTSEECSKKIAQRIGASLVYVSDGAHGFPYTHPHDSASLINEFCSTNLDSQDSPAK